MLKFLKEFVEIANLPFNEVVKDFNVLFVGGKVVVVNNYIKILSYKEDFVCLKVRENEVCIEGQKISIKELSKSDICLVGNINKVYLAKEINNEKK